VHLGDEVGASDRQQLVAPLEVLPAEVVGREVLVLHVGAERAIEHHHAFVDGLEIPGSFGGSHRRAKAKTSSVTIS